MASAVAHALARKEKYNPDLYEWTRVMPREILSLFVLKNCAMI